jgi:tetratricopeptide (TPR) repeat protein
MKNNESKIDISNLTLEDAKSFNKQGVAYYHQGKLNKTLEQFQLALQIQERDAPDSLDLATAYNNIGEVYRSQEKPDEALNLFQKAFTIRQRDLIPSHPGLVSLAYDISTTALSLGQYDLALKYANIAIDKDPKYKYSHDSKGLILQKQGKLEAALDSFNNALDIDPNYADATLHKLELAAQIAQLAGKVGNVEAVEKDIEAAKHLQKSDFDAKYKAELEARARAAGDKDVKIELPKQEFEAGDQKFIERLNKLERQLSMTNRKLAATEEKVGVIEEKVKTLESRMDIFDTKLYTLSHSMDIIKRSMADIDQKVEDEKIKNSPNQSMLKDLAQERAKLIAREKHVKEFNRNPDLRHYYNSLLSEIEASYIAAQAVGSGSLKAKETESYSKAAGYIGALLELVPVVGQLASNVIGGIGATADIHQNATNRNELLRIREISPTIEDFDKIALRVAVEFTLANQDAIRALNKAEVTKDWKSHVGAITGGLEELITSFIKDNETQAKLLGRAQGHKVINYLKEEAIAENLGITEAEEEKADSPLEEKAGESNFASSVGRKTKHSLIATEITRELINRENQAREIVSEAVASSHNKPKETNAERVVRQRGEAQEKGCCVVS